MDQIHIYIYIFLNSDKKLERLSPLHIYINELVKIMILYKRVINMVKDYVQSHASLYIYIYMYLLTSTGKIEVFVMMNMRNQRISILVCPNAVATFPHSFITRRKVVPILSKH